jgi:hypothetical protein
VTHIIATNEGASIIAQDGDVEAAHDVSAGDGLYTGSGLIYADNGPDAQVLLAANGASESWRDIDLSSPEPQSTTDWFRWFGSTLSDEGVPEAWEIMRLDDESRPNLHIRGSFFTRNDAIAVMMQSFGANLAPGDVVALDPDNPHAVVRASQQGLAPIGVVVEKGGLTLGMDMDGVAPELLAQADAAGWAGDIPKQQALMAQWHAAQEQGHEVAVAFAGIASVTLSASGPHPALGDELGVSSQSGLAQCQTEDGPVLGVALADWDGSGSVLALIRPRAADKTASAAEQASGTGLLPKGALQVQVHDSGLLPDQHPLITFYGDPGSRSWIEAKGVGWFTLRLAEPAPADVSFGWQTLGR